MACITGELEIGCLANEMTKGDREVQVFLNWELWR